MTGGGKMRLRRIRSAGGVLATALCAGAAAAVLLVILGYTMREGMGAISIPFLTQVPHPVGVPGGGVGNGIAGTAIMVGIATAAALPIGVLAGIWVALFGRGWAAEAVRFLADVLSGVPSIAIGLFAYAVLVEPFGHFSAISASFAFAVLMLPIIVRTAETAIAAVPRAIQESALALGVSNYATTVKVVLPAARSGIITGLLLAVARVTGETAPLLFTAFGSQFWAVNPAQPMAELSLQVFTYALSPYKSWHAQAWGGAFILIIAVFLLSVLARFAFRARLDSGR